MMTAAALGVAWVLWNAAPAPSAPAADPTLADLAFLAGAWEATEDAESMREVWDAPRGDAMVGHFSIVQEGHAALYELFTVEEGEEGLAIRLRHFGRGLEPWASEAAGPLTMRLVEAGEGRALFEDPERDFPRTLSYTLEGDTLTTRLAPAPDSEREEIVITFTRAED